MQFNSPRCCRECPSLFHECLHSLVHLFASAVADAAAPAADYSAGSPWIVVVVVVVVVVVDLHRTVAVAAVQADEQTALEQTESRSSTHRTAQHVMAEC